MTAFAIDFQPQRLTIASDTLAYAVGEGFTRPLGFIDKVLPVTRLNAVIFNRGQFQICVQAQAYLALAVDLKSLEEAAQALPAALRQITAAYAAQIGLDDACSHLVAEISFAGWSETDQRMKVWQFVNTEDFAPHEYGPAQYGLMTAPALPRGDWPAMAGLSLERQLTELMKAERRLYEANPELVGHAIIGGEVRSLELTPEGMRTQTLHRFEDFEEIRHAGAAVAERINRGDFNPNTAAAFTRADDVVDPREGGARRA